MGHEGKSFGDPGVTRTRNPRLRRPVLYPVELRDLPSNRPGFYCRRRCLFNRQQQIVRFYIIVRVH